MSSHSLNGGCHCGGLRIELDLPRAPASYAPRACDCDFCRKHGAAYLSDPEGRLRIRARPEALGRYRQGSGRAEFLFCRNCAVLVGVAYEEQGRLYATVNSRVVEGDAPFAEQRSVSPQTLSADEKVARWKEVWFSEVRIDSDASA
ncbi:GFA family protein [Azoarcus sp. KH32C]|uniref:GFA family protein n=1 Tax=Azoarcus sp. KH32C TaxID=748247 RepID=UPI0002387084|nr:glutathione-dependent formaldehyde-activating GFA [Azoarcus sp. KH32C]BAL26680.1 glutathione-dependent formaldehyde-activating GFA [Azoarcus sp. KH32C]